jgi:hypothetical protein
MARRANIITLRGAVAVLPLAVLVGGCAATSVQDGDAAGFMAKVQQQVERQAIDIAALKQEITAGRDVNEPWTARLLAVGSTYVWPVVLLFMYMASRRFAGLRALINWIKGNGVRDTK